MTRPLVVLALAVALALSTAWLERRGPLVTVSGEGFCGAEASAPCEVAAVGGGWPVAFLVDDPQVSVPDRPSFFEDDFRWAAFTLDVGVFAAVMGAAGWAVRRTGRPA